MDTGFIAKKVQFLYGRQGIEGVLAALGRKLYRYGISMPGYLIEYIWVTNTRRLRIPTFQFRGNTYRYLYSLRNVAWTTERIVEVPLVLPYLAKAYAEHKKILEVGDVIRQYSEFRSHDIVDKYEYRKGVMNDDINEFKPKQKYDLIVSVSTMEHVGFNAPDEPDPEKIPNAFNLFKNEFLAPGGIAVITMPIGFNPNVDKRLREHSFPFAKTYFMKRISKDNQWEEATEEEALAKQYNAPFNNANAVVIGIIEAGK